MRSFGWGQATVVAIIMFGAGAFLAGTNEAKAQVGLRDLTCYPVLGRAPGFTVSLTDQFANQQLRVGPPALLCTPVRKTVIEGRQIDGRGDHLKCYTVAGEIRRSRRVDLSNQFGMEIGVSVRRGATLLCISTAKRVRE